MENDFSTKNKYLCIRLYAPSWYVANWQVAAIAQLVERFTRNEEVPSSSLGCGSENQQVIEMMICWFFCLSGLRLGL